MSNKSKGYYTNFVKIKFGWQQIYQVLDEDTSLVSHHLEATLDTKCEH